MSQPAKHLCKQNKNYAIPIAGMCRVVLLIIAVGISYSTAFAQQECEENLQTAQRLYNEGKLKLVPSILRNCVELFETDAETVTAYRLIIYSHLYQDQEKEAEEAFERLLRFEKEFKPSNTDPAEFRRLYESFRTAPILTIGPLFGTNLSYAQSTKSFGVHNTDSVGKDYDDKIGIQAGIALDWMLTPALHMVSGIQFATSQFEIKLPMYGFTEHIMLEQQSLLEMPIGLKYTFYPQKSVKPFIAAGAVGSYMLASEINPSRTIDTDVIQTGNVEGPSIQLLEGSELRQRLNWSYFGALGLSYKVKGGLIFLQGNYFLGGRNQAVADNRYDNSELVYSYGYVSDDFTLNRLSVSIGFQLAFYNPKKIR